MNLDLNTLKKYARTANIGLAIVGQTVVNSALVILFSFCAKVGLTFFKCPTIAKPSDVGGNFEETINNEKHSRK